MPAPQQLEQNEFRTPLDREGLLQRKEVAIEAAKLAKNIELSDLKGSELHQRASALATLDLVKDKPATYFSSAPTKGHLRYAKDDLGLLQGAFAEYTRVSKAAEGAMGIQYQSAAIDAKDKMKAAAGHADMKSFWAAADAYSKEYLEISCRSSFDSDLESKADAQRELAGKSLVDKY